MSWKYGSLKPPGTLWATPGLQYLYIQKYIKKKSVLYICREVNFVKLPVGPTKYYPYH
jgi:hypothetical protein